MTKRFYIQHAFQRCHCTASAIADCYSDYIELNATTGVEALNEARRIQRAHDDAAWLVLEASGFDWELDQSYMNSPCYVNCVYYDDEDADEFCVQVEP